MNHNHWCLVVVDIQKKTCSYYDSLPNSEPISVLLPITEFFDHYAIDKNKMNGKPWTYNIANTPKQSNIYDCGVFLCTFMDFIASAHPFDFNSTDMLYFRILIGLRLVKEKVIYIDE